MRKEYVLKAFNKTGRCFIECSFFCTRSQIDRVFYSLSFAAPNSDIVHASLYRVARRSNGSIVRFDFVNSFVCKSAENLLTNHCAAHLMGLSIEQGG